MDFAGRSSLTNFKRDCSLFYIEMHRRLMAKTISSDRQIKEPSLSAADRFSSAQVPHERHVKPMDSWNDYMFDG